MKISDINKFFNSPEGEKAIKDFKNEIEKEENLLKSNISRLHKKFGNNIDFIIKKVYDKYESDEYVKREYKIGYMPRTDLYFLIYEYAKVHGNECFDQEYFNPFTSGCYYLGSYVIQRMDGQGSVIKISDNKKINKIMGNVSNLHYDKR